MQKDFTIENLGCAHCVQKIESQLKDHVGIEAITIDLVNKTGQMTFDDQTIQPDQIVEALNEIGYHLVWRRQS